MSLLANSSLNSILKVGNKAPNFVLDSEKGEQWRLSDYLGNVVALLFYPQDETLVCTKQMCSIRDNWSDYLETKAVVVGVSPGTVEEHKQFSNRHRLPLPLLADTGRKITRIYGEHWIYPIQITRAIVIVDAKGIIRHRKIMLRAFRPTDKSVIASIYAARTEALYQSFENLIQESRENNKRLEKEIDRVEIL